MSPSFGGSDELAPASAPLPPLLHRPSLALAAASCLRHAGLRSTWCSAGFGDRAPWRKLWEATFADDEDEVEEEEEEGEGEGSSSGFDVDRAAPTPARP